MVDYLEENFADIMNYNFTAELEKELDLVSEGKLDWSDGIDKFYKKLAMDLAEGQGRQKSGAADRREMPRLRAATW